MNHYEVTHVTRYEYEAPVLHSRHLAHLRPAGLNHQRVQGVTLTIDPECRHRQSLFDYFGNACDSFELEGAHDRMEVRAFSTVSVTGQGTPDAASKQLTVAAAQLALGSPNASLGEQEFCFNSPLVRTHQMLRDYAEKIFAPNRSLFQALIDLTLQIHKDFRYEPASTDITTPLAQVMRERRGVCQDFAHVAIGCLRSLGLAARYASGYIETLPPAGKPRLVGADASHAWVSALIPGWGWFDLDPTNAIPAGKQHITVAYGRDFSDVSPLKGVVEGGGRHILKVSVDVKAVLAVVLNSPQ